MTARRRTAAVLALLVAATGLLLGAAPGAASAMPAPLAAPGSDGDDGEGGTKTLVEQLEAASKGYVEAQEKLAASKKRQQELTTGLTALEARLGTKQAALDELVRRTYQTGRLGPMGAVLTAESSGSMMDRVRTLETLAVKQEHVVDELTQTRDEQKKAKSAIDAEVRNQQQQVAVMAKRKTQAEDTLEAAQAREKAAREKAEAEANAETAASRSTGSSSKTASPAPRNSDGSLLSEGCSVNDPTTDGCITPRTLHAMQEAQAAGFTHYVACFRHQNSGEHPKGRACDFAAEKNGFGGVATGADKTYGTNLANYFIDNASRLGVLYVIWYKRIWLPSTGWKAYSRGNGDPSSDHTNHVHLSMR